MAGGKLAEAGSGEASKDRLLPVLPWFGRVDDLCRNSLPVLCLLELNLNENVKTSFFLLLTAHKESEQHRDWLGLGRHLPLAAVSGYFPLRPGCASSLSKGRRRLRCVPKLSGNHPD